MLNTANFGVAKQNKSLQVHNMPSTILYCVFHSLLARQLKF